MMSKKTVRTYDEETKVQAVKLAKEIGTQKAAVQLNIPYGTLDGWRRKSKLGEVDLGIGSQSQILLLFDKQNTKNEKSRKSP